MSWRIFILPPPGGNQQRLAQQQRTRKRMADAVAAADRAAAAHARALETERLACLEEPEHDLRPAFAAVEREHKQRRLQMLNKS